MNTLRRWFDQLFCRHDWHVIYATRDAWRWLDIEQCMRCDRLRVLARSRKPCPHHFHHQVFTYGRGNMLREWWSCCWCDARWVFKDEAVDQTARCRARENRNCQVGPFVSQGGMW